MTILQSVLLGILQGIAEFLPISSSGHLVIVQKLFGLEELPLIFDVMLHLATLLAVVLFFWKKIEALFGALFRWIGKKSESTDVPLQKMIVAVILGTVVTGVLGIVVEKLLPDMPLKVVCAGFLVTSVLLITSSMYGARLEKKEGTDVQVNAKKGLLVGLAQGIGTLPGISRSGITISASLFAGIDRTTAGEFSFILSIPAILGAFILEAKDLGEVASSVGALPIICGCAAAFVSGLLALKFLMKLVNKGKLGWFACYLIPAGILGIIFL